MQTPIDVGEVELAATRIRFELCCPAIGQEAAMITFDQRDGVIIASIEDSGWMRSLPAMQAELLRVALLGFYKLAAVDMISENIRTPFDIRRRHLVLWPDGNFEHELVHDLSDAPPEIQKLLFNRVELPWSLWRRVWDAQTPSEIAELTGQILPDVEVLPAGCERSISRTGPTAGFPVMQRADVIPAPTMAPATP
jgi:hypothetical protein